jgi:hypothetical protein
LCVVRLKRNEHKRRKCRLFHQPIATSHTKFALGIK